MVLLKAFFVKQGSLYVVNIAQFYMEHQTGFPRSPMTVQTLFHAVIRSSSV